jgi:hypothetical protein
VLARLVNLDTPRVRRLSSSRYPQHSIIPHATIAGENPPASDRTHGAR